MTVIGLLALAPGQTCARLRGAVVIEQRERNANRMQTVRIERSGPLHLLILRNFVGIRPGGKRDRTGVGYTLNWT